MAKPEESPEVIKTLGNAEIIEKASEQNKKTDS